MLGTIKFPILIFRIKIQVENHGKWKLEILKKKNEKQQSKKLMRNSKRP